MKRLCRHKLPFLGDQINVNFGSSSTIWFFNRTLFLFINSSVTLSFHILKKSPFVMINSLTGKRLTRRFVSGEELFIPVKLICLYVGQVGTPAVKFYLTYKVSWILLWPRDHPYNRQWCLIESEQIFYVSVKSHKNLRIFPRFYFSQAQSRLVPIAEVIYRAQILNLRFPWHRYSEINCFSQIT